MPGGTSTSRAPSFTRNASSTALTQVARTFLGLGLAVILARWLSEADRGIYAVVATLAFFGDQLSQLGMRMTVIYRMSQPGVARARAVGAALELTFGAFALLAVIALLFVDPLRERLLLGADPVLVYVALVIAGADLFSGFGDAVARGMNRFDLHNADVIAIASLTLVVTWLSLVVLQIGLLGTLLATAAARVGLLLLFGALTLRRSGAALSFDRQELGESLRFGAKGHLQVLLGRLHERVDVMLMAMLHVEPAQIAVYAVAVSVIDRLRVVPDSVSTALLPRLATMAPAQRGADTARVARGLAFWVSVSGLGLACVAPFLMPLVFGAPYAASALPLLVLLPATLMLAVRTTLSVYFVAVGRPGFNLRAQAAAVAVNVAVNLWAIPRFGILGAAFASVLSYSVEAGAALLAFKLSSGCSLRETLVVGRADVELFTLHLRRLRERLGGV
jgi:O-antigen/teichoic acid export membrane protein